MLTGLYAQIQWEEVTAICVAAGAVSAFAVWTISSIVDRKLSEFIAKLDERYYLREIATEKFQAHHERIGRLEHQVEEIQLNGRARPQGD